MKNSTAETQIWRTASNMTQKAVLIIALVVLSIWSFNSCENHRNELSDVRASKSADSTAFIVEKTEDGRTIAIQQARIIKEKSTVKELVEKVNGVNKEYAQLKATVRTERTDIKTEAIGGEPEILEVHDTIDNTPKWFMRLPQEYRFEDTWTGVYYTIDTSGQSTIDKLVYMNKPLITFGFQKRKIIKQQLKDMVEKSIATDGQIAMLARMTKFPQNIFGKQLPVVAYTDKNPHSNVTAMQNFIFEPEKKLLQRKGPYIIFAFIAGMYVKSKLK